MADQSLPAKSKRETFEERHRERYAKVLRREMTLENALRENDADWANLKDQEVHDA